MVLKIHNLVKWRLYIESVDSYTDIVFPIHWSHYKENTVSGRSYLYNGNPFAWKDYCYIETEPYTPNHALRNLSCSFIPFQLQWHSPAKNSRKMASLNVRPHPATCPALSPRRPDEVLSPPRGYCGLYRASISTSHCWILLSICLAMRLIWNMVIVLLVSSYQDAEIQLSSKKRIGIHACQTVWSVNGEL